jgi:AcrR family transcriptional regulator
MAESHPEPVPRIDRRARRREETVREIFRFALEIMARDGVAALTMSKLARALDIQPPSLYKYFPSRIEIFDALFEQGQLDNLRELREGLDSTTDRGLSALVAGLERTARWAFAHPVVAELLFWRPVPGFVPTDAAFRPTYELVDLIRSELRFAARQDEINAEAYSEDGLALLSSMHFGVISQHLANEPSTDWDESRFARAHSRVLRTFALAYPAG